MENYFLVEIRGSASSTWHSRYIFRWKINEIVLNLISCFDVIPRINYERTISWHNGEKNNPSTKMVRHSVYSQFHNSRTVLHFRFIYCCVFVMILNARKWFKMLVVWLGVSMSIQRISYMCLPGGFTCQYACARLEFGWSLRDMGLRILHGSKH